MRKLWWAALIAGAVPAASAWMLTAPVTLDARAVSESVPDIARGREMFFAGGCASCHSAPDAKGEDKLRLGGGRAFATDFGTFFAPNISPHPSEGIGSWSALDLANALLKGTSPGGQHYYPAFPYMSYAQMTAGDVVSLHAFLGTLPKDGTGNRPHDVSLPFSIRRALGGWKLLYSRDGWIVDGDLTDLQERGRYLVEGPGHCGECHTERNFLGGLKREVWLAGAPNPGGKGRIPDITPDGLDWSEADIAEYLKSGFTPDFDTAGGEMADVIENTSKLTGKDRAAIAAYLKIVPGGN